MKRNITEHLIEWSENPKRKPLLLQGARQVGKTYILKFFGDKFFSHYHYLNFEDKRLHSIFHDGPFDTEKILFRIEAHFNKAINRAKDLLIFDEIQDCPHAISSLKYFCENNPELKISCAGSHIGIARGLDPFPVGKVNFLTLYPMTFDEFLEESNTHLHKALINGIANHQIDQNIHDLLWEQYKYYSFVGGMPEAVGEFLACKQNLFIALTKTRKVHDELLKAYTMDFAKYSGRLNAQKIALVFNNIAKQIQKVHDDSIQRYRFIDVLPGQSKYIHLQGPIEWLVTSGLASKIHLVSKPELPLSAYTKDNLFKLFLFDIGLLAAQLELDPTTVINQTMGSYKGFIAEVFVAQQLQSILGNELYSWQDNKSEIEFLIKDKNRVIPIEVKSGTRTKAKSMAVYKKKFHPEPAIKLSANNLRYEQNHINAPIYLAGYLPDLL